MGFLETERVSCVSIALRIFGVAYIQVRTLCLLSSLPSPPKGQSPEFIRMHYYRYSINLSFKTKMLLIARIFFFSDSTRKI